MKNCLRRHLFVALVALSAVIMAQARDTLTVFGNGDELNWTVPVNLLYLDEVGTRSQVIYPAAMLSEMENEAINSITFYTHSGIEASGGMVRVSVGETTQSTYGTYVEGLTRVATISITPGGTQVVVNFDEPYTYGGGNLVIDTYVEQAGICSLNADLFICDRADAYCSISRGEVSKSIPMATFDYGTDAPYAAKVLPLQLVFSTVRAGHEDVKSLMLKNVGTQPFTPTFNVPAPFVVDIQPMALQPNQTIEVPVKFVPSQAGDYNMTLRIDCAEAGVFNVPLTATAWSAALDLTVCDSIAEGTLPIDGVYIDIVGTQGQMIYPAEMLTDMVGSKIIELKFYPKRMKMSGGVVTLSLMTTDQLEYAQTELLTGLTTVATMTPVKGSSEFVFVLDEPFEYNGGNLVVDALVTEPGQMNLESSAFYGKVFDYWTSLEAWDYYGYNVGFLNFLPKVTFSYQVPEAQWQLGDVNHDKQVNVADVTLLISYVLSGDADILYVAEANVNGDAQGEINVADVTELISVVLSGN